MDYQPIIQKFIQWLTEQGDVELSALFDPTNPTAPDAPPEPPNIVLATDTESTGKAVLTPTADPATTVLHSGPTADSPAVAAANKTTNDRITKLESGLDEILKLLRGSSGSSSE